MRLKTKIALLAVCFSQALFAQNTKTDTLETEMAAESAITFTEAQLGENDDMSQNVTVVGSNSNTYASNVGYLFSPARFKYRGFAASYNDVYINGNPMNDSERGQFSFSHVGGLNNQTRSSESSLPFEDNNYTFSEMGGSSNYNFRPSSFATGHKFSAGAANRNYTLRGIYTYNTGLMANGWAFTGSLTYRWANRGYVKGTWYNALSYFIGAEKRINEQHSLSLVTWGNPTQRSTQGASTDEGYWLANSYTYNPYWGYQNGKIRNSRVVTEYAPTALLTWDWKISKDTKMTTSLSGKYATYKTTKLNYNNSENPQPDYYKKMPSNFYDVWNEDDTYNRTDENFETWERTRDFFTSSEANRQINWDRLYAANESANRTGVDAMYYVQARHNDQMKLTLASAIEHRLSATKKINAGFNAALSKGMHYYTMEDMLGANQFHNINTYATSKYATIAPELQYDVNNPNKSIHKDDRMIADYNIMVNKANAWATYSDNITLLKKNVHYFVSGRIGGTAMWRNGNMRNGLAINNSYGKGRTAHFLDGGLKAAGRVNLGYGHMVSLGAGFQYKAPLASAAFAAPEINNDFVTNLRLERIFSSELAYQWETTWLHANISGFLSKTSKGTEWMALYFDDENSFTYMSLTDISKIYYGLEFGLNFKITTEFNVKAIGNISEAKYSKDAECRYMLSTSGDYNNDHAYIKGMRESGTPLTALSLGLSYHANGWYLDLNGNYYDRIFLSYSPTYRFKGTAEANGLLDNNGNFDYDKAAQTRSNGGFMLDGSIGRSIYTKHGQLSINLLLTNILNKRDFCTGGYEQSRADYTASGNSRTYKFSLNPKKYYAYGFNGMIMVSYRF